MAYQEQRLSAEAVSAAANFIEQPEAEPPGPFSLKEKCPIQSGTSTVVYL